MKLIFILVILVTVIHCVTAWRNFISELDELRTSRSYEPSEEQWFTQFLNHFNPVDNRVWKQRYFVSDEFYKAHGPVFLFIGGESQITDKRVHEGPMFDEAKRYGAKMFIIEHRFYGKSQPTSNLSVENLAYLSAQQALLDAAYFIEGMNKLHELPKDTKWIVFGCSYSGSLAAWMRAKYPHLVHGAVSGSAPLLAKVDFSEYFGVVEEAFKTHSQSCVNVLSNATREVDKMLLSSSDRKKLGEVLKLCNTFESETTTKNDIASLHENIAGIFAYVVQLNDALRITNKITIDKLCDILVDEKKGDPIDRFVEVNSILLNLIGTKCLDYKYSSMIEELSNVTSSGMWRQWTYQTCTEFGFYQTSAAKNNLFGDAIPLDFHLQKCIDLFGPKFARITQTGVERTNLIFGGLNLAEFVSNVVFVNGNIDPWYPLGITKSNNPRAPAIFINGTSHCANVYPESENDLPQLTEARKKISQLVGEWLKN